MGWLGILGGVGMVGGGIAAITTGFLAPLGVPLIGAGLTTIAGTTLYDYVVPKASSSTTSPNIVSEIGSFGFVIIAAFLIFMLTKK